MARPAFGGVDLMAVEPGPQLRRRQAMIRFSRMRRSKGKQAQPKRHRNRLHVSRSVRRKHRRARK